MEVAPEFSSFDQSTDSTRRPSITVKRRRIALIPPAAATNTESSIAVPPARTAPKVYRLPIEALTVEAELAPPPPTQRRQRGDPLRKAVVLRHEVFDTGTKAPQAAAGLSKYRDALNALAAIERDLRIVASCRKFLRSFSTERRK